MAKERTQRRLAAILAADVAGFSRLVRTDEERTLADLRAHRIQLTDPAIAEHGGRIANTAGDSVLAEFPSMVEAMRCALAIQQGMAARNTGIDADRRIEFRIGLNLGDVIDQEGDLLGDGVNVAARLEGLADPGGICLSRAARDQVRDRLDMPLVDMGNIAVKNIERPQRVFRVVMGDAGGQAPRRPRRLGALVGAALMVLAVAAGALLWFEPWVSRIDRVATERMAHALPAAPSIAVLPFTNLSDSKEQDYFADGVTEDIITDLSKISGIFVVARNSTFIFKNRAVTVQQVAQELGVRYVLEGSVRRFGDKMRITAQLSDVIGGRNLWSGRFDRPVQDVFAVQTEVTARVVKAMAVTLKANELDRVYQKYVTGIDAYDAFVRARRIVDPPGKDSIAAAQELFRRAIELDRKFAGGYAGLAFSYSSSARLRLGESPDEDARLSLEYARKALQVDPNFAWSYIALGGAELANGKIEAAVDAARNAVRLQPNGYEERLFLGFYLTFAGQSEEAVKHLELAARISPVESVRGLAFLSNAYFMNGQYEKSVTLRKRRVQNFPVRNPNPYIWLAATQYLMGDKQDAEATAAELRRTWPAFRMSEWRYFDTFKLEENRKRLYDAAVSAGVTE